MSKHFIFILVLFSVTISAQEKIIESISFDGLSKTKEIYLKKLLSINKGSPADSLLLAEDMIRLIREPAISHAYYSMVNSEKERLQLTIHIEENKTLIPALDIWQTLENELAFHLGATDHNFLGKGYTIGAFYRQNNFPGYGVILENNNFISANNELKFIFQHRETLEPIQQEDVEALYRYRIESAETSFGRELNLKNKVFAGIGISNEHYMYRSGAILSQVPQEFKTNKIIGKIGYNYDAIFPFYYFNSGWKNQLILTHVWGKTISNRNTFYSIENQTVYFKRIKEFGNLGFRLKLGLAKNINTLFPPFAIDNNRNVRGSGNLIQRGSSLWAFNSEYRHGLIEKKWFVLQGNLFVDFAGIRPSGNTINNIFKPKNTHAYSGIGLRFIHKYIYNAVLRIDYGFALGSSKVKGLVFGIGQYF